MEAIEPRVTVVLAINSSWNIVNFRSGLVGALKQEGYRVVGMAPRDAHSDKLESLGCEFVSIPFASRGINPLADIFILFKYVRILRKIRPDVYLGYTAKPNIYGSIAAGLLGIPVINNISGLGTAFLGKRWLQLVVEGLYRFALRKSKAVFFQNHEDMALFIRNKVISADAAKIIPGSGVNLLKFQPAALPVRGKTAELIFLYVGRLLYDKGISEFVAAARVLRSEGCRVRFGILGFASFDSKGAVDEETFRSWTMDGDVEYFGSTDDVRPYLRDADCVVLPSYREGLPRSLLEAAALGRPLIATNVPGCRQVVSNGVNGLLCEPMNAQDLARAMREMAAMSAEARQALGKAGRMKVESEYDEQLVLSEYILTIRQVLDRGSGMYKRSATVEQQTHGSGPKPDQKLGSKTIR